MVEHEPEPKRFSPKVPVELDPPKDDPISPEELAQCDGRYSRLSQQPERFPLTHASCRLGSQSPDPGRHQGRRL